MSTIGIRRARFEARTRARSEPAPDHDLSPCARCLTAPLNERLIPMPPSQAKKGRDGREFAGPWLTSVAGACGTCTGNPPSEIYRRNNDIAAPGFILPGAPDLSMTYLFAASSMVCRQLNGKSKAQHPYDDGGATRHLVRS
jgi:hypothetical protein